MNTFENTPKHKESPSSQLKARSSQTEIHPEFTNHPVLDLQRKVGNQSVSRWLGSGKSGETPSEASGSSLPDKKSPSHVDVLSNEGETTHGQCIDETGSPAAGAAAGAAVGAAAGAAAAGPARPTQLYQILTNWTPGPNRYGFQLKFRCRSTSGNVRDLQSQAPNLIWRERVTYSRNDFAHRITPNNPTILPPGGVSFAPASTRVVGTNLLEFTTATDTHWMPTWAVRANDFRTNAAPPPAGFVGPLRPALPAIMESRQVYQYSANGGTSWNYFAGAFNIRRTFFNDGGTLKFRVRKIGIHSPPAVNYKP